LTVLEGAEGVFIQGKHPEGLHLLPLEEERKRASKKERRKENVFEEQTQREVQNKKEPPRGLGIKGNRRTAWEVMK